MSLKDEHVEESQIQPQDYPTLASDKDPNHHESLHFQKEGGNATTFSATQISRAFPHCVSTSTFISSDGRDHT